MREYTALKYHQHGIDITKAALSSISKGQTPYKAAYFAKGADNPYYMDNGKGGKENFSWLL